MWMLRNKISNMSTRPTIGFVGLGKMGTMMALNLMKNGYKFRGFDKSEQSFEKIVGGGGEIVQDLKTLAEKSDVIITMLPNSPQVKQVYLGPEQGMLEFLRPGTLCIDSSTINPLVSKQLEEKIKATGSYFVDAPVSGGVTGAEAGTLTFMVGGDEDAFKMAEPVLLSMGKAAIHCGGPGSGSAAKVVNNLALGIQMIAVAEAMNLGTKLGLDPKVLAGVMNSSSGRCWSSDSYNPWPGVMKHVPASNGYAGGFATALMQKDLGLALDAAREVEALLPMGSLSLQLYTMLSSQGKGQKDFGAILELIRGRNFDV